MQLTMFGPDADSPPLIILWENVPGVLNVPDNAFGCFLGAMVGSDSPLVCPSGLKWTDAGLVSGPRRTAAWRLLDAQYFGVPQRRERVFVVASAGEHSYPAEILLNEPRVSGHPPARTEARKGFAHDVAPSLTGSGRGVDRRGRAEDKIR